jgi:hypothetical protein
MLLVIEKSAYHNYFGQIKKQNYFATFSTLLSADTKKKSIRNQVQRPKLWTL